MSQIHFSRKTIQFLIFLADLLVYLIAIWTALLIRRFECPTFCYWYNHVKMFLPILLYGICAMYLLGLYVVNRPIGYRTILTKLSMIGILGCGVGFVFFYFNKDNIHFPKTILFLFWLFFCFFSWLIRVTLVFYKKRKLIPVVFLGNSKSLESLINDINNNQMLGYKSIFEYKNETYRELLLKIFENKDISEFIFVYRNNDELLNEINDKLNSLIANGVQFIEYSDF